LLNIKRVANTFTNNHTGRAAKRNTQGGKAFKSMKKGGLDPRLNSAHNMAEELLEMIESWDTLGYDKLSSEVKIALLSTQVGRVDRKFGFNRMEVFCQDGKVRNCAIRGLLCKKKKCPINIGDLVVVELAEPLDELYSSDKSGLIGFGKEMLGASFRAMSNQSFITGIFSPRSKLALSKTHINPRLFNVLTVTGEEEEDFFELDVETEEESPIVMGGCVPVRMRKGNDTFVSATASRLISGATAAHFRIAEDTGSGGGGRDED
jgi:translation initiation factor IF-1